MLSSDGWPGSRRVLQPRSRALSQLSGSLGSNHFPGLPPVNCTLPLVCRLTHRRPFTRTRWRSAGLRPSPPSPSSSEVCGREKRSFRYIVWFSLFFVTGALVKVFQRVTWHQLVCRNTFTSGRCRSSLSQQRRDVSSPSVTGMLLKLKLSAKRKDWPLKWGSEVSFLSTF